MSDDIARPRARAGATLIEALAALTLSSLVATLIIGVCVAQMRLASVTAERAVATEAARATVAVLSGEARRTIMADVRASGGDSLAMRSFRGAGLPCGTTAGGVLVRYVGDRMADPAKDSVLVVARSGEASLQLLDSRPADGLCMARPGEAVLEWRMNGLPGGPAILLVFESGVYHLSTGALRYRIGAAGRQPLTPEALRHPFTRFTDVNARAIEFQVDAGGHRAAFAATFAAHLVPP